MIEQINHIAVKQVSLVGAGPGGIEHLTLKAYKAISLAEVVLYDDLIKHLLEDIVSPGAELIDVGKRLNDGINQNERQTYINELIHKFYKAGKRVVRLKGGDPMIFGKINEEISFLKGNAVDFEIIPGISAGQAGAAIFQIPLTVRGKATELLFSTAQKINSEVTDYSKWGNLINQGTPLLIYMGATKIKDIAQAFINEGVTDTVHIHALSKVGTAEQSIFSSTLTKLVNIPAPDIALPAVLVIGKNAIIH